MPTRRRGVVREEAILQAAMTLLGEVGYDRMTIDAVAERAHASNDAAGFASCYGPHRRSPP